MGVLSAFRSPVIRSVNSRWIDADHIVTQNHGRALLNAAESKRALWHADKCVRDVIRLMTLTNKFARMPMREDIRAGDEFYLSAVDLMGDNENKRTRHTIECLLLGGASDAQIEEYTGIAAGVAGAIHDLFFDIRGRLNRSLIIQDLLFAPSMMQGGAKSPLDVERAVAFLAGHRVYFSYRTGLTDSDESSNAYKLIQKGLMSNQSIGALMRRSFGYESTEGVIEHIHQHMLLQARDNKGTDENLNLKKVRKGLAAMSESIKPQVVSKGDPAFTDKKAESVTSSLDKVKEILA